MKIPIQDAIEILNMEGYDIPETDEEIYIDIPEEFTIEELYETVKDSMKDNENDCESKIFNNLPEKTQKSLLRRKSNFFFMGENWKTVIEKSLKNPDMWVETKEVPDKSDDRLIGGNLITEYFLCGADGLKVYRRKIPKGFYDYYVMLRECYGKQTFNVGDWIRWEGNHGGVIEGQIEFIERASHGFKYAVRTRDGETYSVYDYKGKITKI